MALTNSLYKNAFGGEIFDGYKGILSVWASLASPNATIGWNRAKILAIEEGSKIPFRSWETEFHPTN